MSVNAICNYNLYFVPQMYDSSVLNNSGDYISNLLLFKKNDGLCRTNTIRPEIKYYESSWDKVNQSTKNAVNEALKECAKHVNPQFFEGMTIHIASDFSQIDDHNAFSKLTRLCEKDMSSALGIVYDGNNREIYIQERMFQSQNHMKNVVLHEMGHSFDEYYGCQNKEMQIEYYNLRTQSLRRLLTPEEKSFMREYETLNNYSDTDAFKEALIKDFEKMDVKKAYKKFEYLLHSFVGFTCQKPNEQKIKENDYGRSEIFAQLFSYAVGADENKKEFLKLFPNTYKVVQKFINENK